MSGDPRVAITFDASAVERAFARLPKIVNVEFNRAFGRIAGAFYQRFNPRLTGEALKVRRALAKGRGRRRVPKESAALGFRAHVGHREQIPGKNLELWSKSPLVKAHEFGAVIHATKGIQGVRGRGFGAKKGFLLAIGKPPRPWRKAGGGAYQQGELIKLVREVRIKPKLGFYTTWKSFEGEAAQRFYKAMAQIEDRVEGAAKAGATA